MKMKYEGFWPTKEERLFDDIDYSVYAIIADKFNCVRISCKMKATTKEKAFALCKKYNADMNRPCDCKIKYVVIHTEEQLANIQAKADEINAVNIPKREKHIEAVHNEMKRVQKLRDKEMSRLAAVGWHYDNQQRVNEYKGTMRG